MARKGKQYVFSARTTEEGLKRLGELRQERRMGWDELVIEAMCAHYELDKAMMTLPRKGTPTNEVQPAEQPPTSEPVTEQPTAVEPGDVNPVKKQRKGKKGAHSKAKVSEVGR